MIRDYRASLEATMVKAAEALARLDATPDPSDYPDGTVFYVRRQFENGGTEYHYVYVRTPVGWFGTGNMGARMTDEDFRHIVLMSNDVQEISVATAWSVLAGDAPESEDADEFED